MTSRLVLLAISPRGNVFYILLYVLTTGILSAFIALVNSLNSSIAGHVLFSAFSYFLFFNERNPYIL